MSKRFIDLATHGGCSRKGPARQVRDLLAAVQKSHASSELESISKNFPDVGTFIYGAGPLLSTVDIVLPMTLSPSHFGAITACHVLSDLYASGGSPLFALCILGLPNGLSAASDEAVEVLGSAVDRLAAEKCVLVGGHTMTEQEDFYLGFAVVGRPMAEKPFDQGAARPGDVLLLTKALGTSIATTRWKLGEADEAEHSDVITGMLQSNLAAAKALTGFPVHACTDVTGYGFLGHLYNILYASGVGAKIRISDLPVYKSVSAIQNPDHSSQALHNMNYVRASLVGTENLTTFEEAILFDSQVSGGFIVVVPADSAPAVCEELVGAGCEASPVGQIVEGPSGHIELCRTP